jgi:hypothetical protein
MKDIVYIQRKFDPKTLPRNPSKAISGIFYHGVILSGEYGWYAALNVLESGMLQTPNYIAYWDPNFASRHCSARYQDIRSLKYNGQNIGGLTPTALHYINIASGIREGLHIRKGAIKLAKDQERGIIDRSKIEIKFEMERRKYAKNAVSRLECLYVADKESVIKEMFNYHPDLVILKVKIAEALNCTRVDPKWYEGYRQTRTKKYIKKYWTGQTYNEGILNWEYLVDGLIIIDDTKNLAYLNSFKKEIEEEFKYQIGASADKSLFIPYLSSHLR